jgi:hypothetical protein
MATKKGMTTNFFSPLSFVAVFGSGIRDGQKSEFGIRDKPLGSEPPLFFLVIHAIVSLGGHWTCQHRPPSESTTATTAAIRLSATAETAGPEETAHTAISHAAPAATNYTSTAADVATATAADSHPATGPAAATEREPEPAAAAVSSASTTAVVAAEAVRRGSSAATANDSSFGKLETFTNGGN